jgi:hypothetical protein
MLRWFLGLAMLFLGWPVVAQEPSACWDAALSSQQHSSEALVTLARSCITPEVSELLLNRAQHRRLLRKYDRFERSLQHFGERDHRAYIESYRIHIGLAEAFAGMQMRQGDKAVLKRLNRLYDQAGEIAEMRFRGYDLIADRLEKKYRL